MKNTFQKSLIVLAVLLNFTVAASCSFAKETVLPKDPDLKLSIEELKKKYPPSLLEQKNKTYKVGQKVDISDFSNAEIKAAFLNADKNFKKRDFVRGNTPDNKSRFTQLGKNLYEKFEVINAQELLAIEAACEQFGINSSESNFSPDRIEIRSFITSGRIIRFVMPFLPYGVASCLVEEDRN